MAQSAKPFTGVFEPCPDTPNCVSTQARPGDAEHYLAPIEVSGDADVVMTKAIEVLTKLPRTKLVEQAGTYARLEARSLIFRFVDDIELYLDEEKGLLHVRSAARLGRSDLGVNRKRMNEFVAALRSRL